MAEETIVHMGENSPEGVAFKLFKEITYCPGAKTDDKKWILDTFAECLRTVRDPRRPA